MKTCIRNRKLNNAFRRTLAAIPAVLLLAAALLSGCSVQPEYPQPLPVADATPPPLLSQEARTLTLPLYFISADGRNLVEQPRAIKCGADHNIVKALLLELFKGAVPAGLATAIPADWQLETVVVSGNTAQVYVSAESSTGINAYLTGRAAVCATLQAALDVTYCNVLVNGILPGYLGRPVGVARPIEGALDVYLANMKQTFDPTEPVESSEAGEYEQRDAVLYFTDTTGRYLLADTRVMRYDAEAPLNLIAASLIEELIKGPVDSEGREPVLPADMILLSEPVIRNLSAAPAAQDAAIATPLTPQGEDTQPEVAEQQAADTKIVVEVEFSKSGTTINKALVYGAIVYTVTGYCPDTVGVRILENGVAVRPETITEAAAGELRDYLTRSDFHGVMGNTVPLAFPESDGSGLHRVMRCMEESLVDDPLARLTALFTGSADPGIPYALFTAEDVLSVSLQRDMAVVNWRAGFLDKLREYVSSSQSQLPQNTREQMFLFGVVDTLTAMPGIRRVWMLEDGARITENADLVFMGDPLLRNPGLLLD